MSVKFFFCDYYEEVLETETYEVGYCVVKANSKEEALKILTGIADATKDSNWEITELDPDGEEIQIDSMQIFKMGEWR